MKAITGSNESWLPQFTSTIIPAVRPLDLSNRPWENSYNAPAGVNDPVEDHQYLFQRTATESSPDQSGIPPFKVTDLESMLGPAPNTQTNKTAHATILNEYGWLWLNRDGTPTLLTQKLYPKLLGDRNTKENRFTLQAYLLGGETEFWRAYRHYAGVLHFVYLTASDPKAFTSDHFVDVKKLELEPHFMRSMEQAFNPLGLYLNFWQPRLSVNETHDYTVAMVNDENSARRGKLRLVFKDEVGNEIAAQEVSFSLPPLGAETYTITLKAPEKLGKYSLQAIAVLDGRDGHQTVSQRDVTLQANAQ